MTRTRAGRPKLLVANRGEIAVRIIRTCREMGIPTVAVYSDADHDALHVEMADESYRIGPALASDSYLSIGAILEAAQKARATLIHPGYGFLAERAHFAQAVDEAGFTFVGPSASAIEQMGDKSAARRLADAAGMPIVPGTREPVDIAHAKKEAPRLGYPLLVKAAFGGGGKGMHVVRDADHLEESLKRAAREAQSYFGRPEVFLERYVDRAHHVEAQIMADARGTVLFLGERDCSVQRRHQKLIEETPSPVVDDAIRERFADAAIALAREAGYVNAGTIECILDEDGSFFFLEMNTRLQVEHTVTEMVTGLDLVALQIQVALGESLAKLEVAARGHAIQCRINAEDPGAELPAGAGTGHRLRGARRPVRPGGLRRDAWTGDPGRLRLDVRQAHRERDRPGPGPPPDAARARRVHGRRRPDDDPRPPVDPRDEGVPRRHAHDDLARARARRTRSFGLRPRASPPAWPPARRGRATSSWRSTADGCRSGSSTSGARPPRKRRPRTAPTTASTSTARSMRRCRARS